MIVLKWIIGIIVGLGIIICLSDWKPGKDDVFNLFAVVVLVLIEVIIIKGWERRWKQENTRE